MGVDPQLSGAPLEGVTVLVPRAPEQASALSGRIRELGGHPVEAPVIEILPGDEDELAAACRRLVDGVYDAVAFTSPNGARAVAAVVRRIDADAAQWQVDLIAAIGPGTARAMRDELGIDPDLVPDTATTAAL
ncbi:MAG: uroporphyrinogen-III synthase, partial [Nitriliruptorales bacterium]|nr:uroporphyrinogen-III synthase [Nitriliruptorales bacterium]